MSKNIMPFVLLACGMLCFSSCSRQNKKSVQVAKPDLIVFTPHPAEKTEEIIREFRQRTGLTVHELHGGTAELLAMLGSGVKADVFWGGGIESLEASKDLFVPYIMGYLPYFCFIKLQNNRMLSLAIFSSTSTIGIKSCRFLST